MQFYTPVALKLHAFGLNRLHDPNWTGINLYDDVKRPVRRGELLSSIEKDGFLQWLGHRLFTEYMTDANFVGDLDGEYLIWFLEDFVQFLVCHGVAETHDKVANVREVIDQIGDLYERDEAAYFRLIESYRRREELIGFHQELIDLFKGTIDSVAASYAANYADRVFHDRELCGFIAQLLVNIGFDGSDDEEPKQWVTRTAIPQWAKKAVYARDRGKCAQCAADILMELEDDDHIDHMVPLARGGCNDLVNLQLLCKPCNLKKTSQLIPVTSSVPPYLLRFNRSSDGTIPS